MSFDTLTTGTGGTDLGEKVSEHSHVGVNVAEAGVVVSHDLMVLSCAVCESDDSPDLRFESVVKSVVGEIRRQLLTEEGTAITVISDYCPIEPSSELNVSKPGDPISKLGC